MCEIVNKRTALLDTGPLTVLLVGLADPLLLGSQAHFKEFSPKDFELLRALLDRFEGFGFTPHSMTEVAHFANKVAGAKGKQVKQALVSIVNQWKEFPIQTKSAERVNDFETATVRI